MTIELEKHSPGAVVLELKCMSESHGELAKSKVEGPIPRKSMLVLLVQGPLFEHLYYRMCTVMDVGTAQGSLVLSLGSEFQSTLSASRTQ
jgi:hypothetical protein